MITSAAAASSRHVDAASSSIAENGGTDTRVRSMRVATSSSVSIPWSTPALTWTPRSASIRKSGAPRPAPPITSTRTSSAGTAVSGDATTTTGRPVAGLGSTSAATPYTLRRSSRVTTSRGCPDATTTPSAMTTNRSHTAAANVRSCSTASTAVPRASASSRISRWSSTT